MEIKQVQKYECPVTGKLFSTREAAEKCADKALAAKEAKRLADEERKKAQEQKESDINYLRLHLENIGDLEKMLIDRMKKCGFFLKDLSIDIDFGWVSNSHECPLGNVTNWSARDKNLPTSYLGWSGFISAYMTCPKNFVPKGLFSDSIAEIIKRNNKGLHTGTGCPGTVNSSKMDIGFSMFLDDFPILKDNYEKYLIEKDKVDQDKEGLSNYEKSAVEYALKTEDVSDVIEEILSLQTKLVILNDRKRDLVNKKVGEWKKANPFMSNDISPDYEDLKINFRNRYEYN